MITSKEAITAKRAKALTDRQDAHLTYVGNLEDEIAAQISYGHYSASIDVREEYAEAFSNYWRTLGYSVVESSPEHGYAKVTVDWEAPRPVPTERREESDEDSTP